LVGELEINSVAMLGLASQRAELLTGSALVSTTGRA
jgi:hypothetical protein